MEEEMKTYVLAYSAEMQLIERGGNRKQRRLRLEEFVCSDINLAKKRASDFLQIRSATRAAQFVGFYTKHEWKPGT